MKMSHHTFAEYISNILAKTIDEHSKTNENRKFLEKIYQILSKVVKTKPN